MDVTDRAMWARFYQGTPPAWSRQATTFRNLTDAPEFLLRLNQAGPGRISVYLPGGRGDHSAMPHPTPSRNSIRRLRVLVVDQDPIIRLVLSTYLGKHEHVVTSVATNAAALRTLDAEHFDVVLMDVRMPDPECMEVLRRVASFMPSTRVVTLSSGDVTLGRDLFAKVAAAYGAFVLEKPFGGEALLAAVEEAAAHAFPRAS